MDDGGNGNKILQKMMVAEGHKISLTVQQFTLICFTGKN